MKGKKYALRFTPKIGEESKYIARLKYFGDKSVKQCKTGSKTI